MLEKLLKTSPFHVKAWKKTAYLQVEIYACSHFSLSRKAHSPEA